MKTIKNLFIAIAVLASTSVFGQINQDINKTSGTVSNGINGIDSIRFNGTSTQMQVVLNNGSVVNHNISDIINVTFSGELIGVISGLNCGTATVTGTLIAGTAASSVSVTVSYTGGNSGSYNAQSVSSTGVTGLTATLAAGSFANGSGALTYTITGTPSGSGTASFALNIGESNCVLTVTVNAALISTLNCAGATINGSLVVGVAASGVSAIVGYTGGNGGTHAGQTVASTGVTGLTATLAAGSFANGSGTLTYTITGTPSGSGTAIFALNIGGANCVLTLTVNVGLISTINCGGATINGILVNGVAANGVSALVGYTGGNGGTHAGQTVASTGVTGLTATLAAGSFANGSGTLTYTITGTPSGGGTASFALNIGGQSCILNIIVNATLPCLSVPTTIIDVTNPTTGRIWMDRNLGAIQAATSSIDPNAYGDLYQWGRGLDGHQCRTSTTTSTLSSIDQPVNGNFIIAPNTPYDWRSPQNVNLWQGVNGINNPCPIGYRLPTDNEFNAERLSWTTLNLAGAFASPLKLTAAGYRAFNTGVVNGAGNEGNYWTSTILGIESRFLSLLPGQAIMNDFNRAGGYSVRCVKN